MPRKIQSLLIETNKLNDNKLRWVNYKNEKDCRCWNAPKLPPKKRGEQRKK